LSKFFQLIAMNAMQNQQNAMMRQNFQLFMPAPAPVPHFGERSMKQKRYTNNFSIFVFGCCILKVILCAIYIIFY